MFANYYSEIFFTALFGEKQEVLLCVCVCVHVVMCVCACLLLVKALDYFVKRLWALST